jgi:hypothetical protein
VEPLLPDESTMMFILELPSTPEAVAGAKRGQDIGGSFGKQVEPIAAALQKRVPVSVQRLKQQVTHLLGVLTEVFDQADRQPNAKIELEEIELTVEVNAEGQLGILGNGGKAGGKGGITLKFKRVEKDG